VVKRVFFFLLLSALATAILDLTSRANRASFAVMLLKELKYPTFSGWF
jgi:hypothetical protein